MSGDPSFKHSPDVKGHLIKVISPANSPPPELIARLKSCESLGDIFKCGTIITLSEQLSLLTL